MKFGKELSSQMVQEWRGAYMDYKHLKSLLKDIIRFRQQNAAASSGRDGFLKRKLSMYRAFSRLTIQPESFKKSTDDDVILVGQIQQEGSEKYCQTAFFRPSEEGGKTELVFFKKLDDEFNKVVRFYEEIVDGVKVEADGLSRQMDVLIALKMKVEKPCVVEKKVEEKEDNRRRDMGVTEEVVTSTEAAAAEGEEIITEEQKENKAKSCSSSSDSLDILDHIKINIDPDSPVSTLRSFIMSSRSDPSFSKVELRKAEEKMRRAFVEFYKKLQLLKNFSYLNMLAFSKIMKKYDKITSRNASKPYMEMVEKSYLGNSEEVYKLIERIEATFTKHLTNGNRQKGMKYLRQRDKKERHTTTFFLGVFTGGSIALLAGIIVTIHAHNLLIHEGKDQYMNNMFPLYSLFVYIILHMLMYGANTYVWKLLRINYPFIFEYKLGTEMGFREIFLVASGLSVLAFAAILSNLDLEMDPETRSFQTITELVPLGLVIVVFFITICPFNIIYRSSRFFLIQCAWHCIWAPLYKVTFSDFFLADQLTSQVQAFRCVQFYICYYGWGDFERRQSNKCLDSDIYEKIYVIVAVIPFWIRALQCLRRLFEEKNPAHAFNSLKYFSTVIALVMRSMYDLRRQTLWQIMAASTSGVTTIYNTYWDIVVDWGLLQKNSKNRWLRDNLSIPNKAVYFVAIVLNILLRLVWMQLVLDFSLPFLHRRAMVTLVACLEIIRRGIWNFFRLENEHFNNVGKYRAFKSVPLPFYYEDGKIM